MRAHARSAGNRVVALHGDDLYGRLIHETAPSAASCSFRYSTKCCDPDLELYYYGHRWYDAAALKWRPPDPISASAVAAGSVIWMQTCMWLFRYCGVLVIVLVTHRGALSWRLAGRVQDPGSGRSLTLGAGRMNGQFPLA